MPAVLSRHLSRRLSMLINAGQSYTNSRYAFWFGLISFRINTLLNSCKNRLDRLWMNQDILSPSHTVSDNSFWYQPTAIRNWCLFLNAGACLIFNFDITPLLRQLHWLRVPEQVTFKLATLMFQCINGTTPRCLSSEVRRVADVPSRKHIRSAASSSLAIPATRRSSTGDCAFVVMAASVWKKLPQDVRSATSLTVFRLRLKTHLFDIAYNC